MIEIRLPEGGVVRFPDGTPAETIESALAEKFGPEKAKKGILGYLDDAARAVAQGVTFGYADEIGAKVNPAINRMLGMDAPETEEEALALERARDADINPILRAGGEAVGAIGATLVAAPVAAAMAPARVAQTAAALPNALKYGALGAGEAALMGSGTAKEGERLEGAAMAAPIGAVAGVAAPMVANGVAGLMGRLRNARSPEARAAVDINRALIRDDTTPAELTAAAREGAAVRPGVATIADAGGENVKGLVERVAQTPGAGRTIVVPRLGGRQRTQAARLGRDLRLLTGTDRTAFRASQEVMAARARASTPAYRAVYQAYNDSLISPTLERFLGADEVVTALKAAAKKARGRSIAEGFGEFNPRATVENDILKFATGRGKRTVYPNLQLWDYARRELDDMASAAYRAGRNNEGSYITSLARQMNEELDTLTDGAYAMARSAWSGPTRYLDSIEAGREIMSPRVSAEEFLDQFDRLPAVEQEAIREGAVSALVGKMGNVAADFADFTRSLKSPEMRKKISGIMPNEELARQWLERLDFEVGTSHLSARTLGNSATYRRAAERAAAEGLVGDMIIDALSGTGGTTMLRRVLTAGPRWLRDTIRSQTDHALGDLLTNPHRIDDLDAALQRAAAQAVPASTGAMIGTTAGGASLMGP